MEDHKVGYDTIVNLTDAISHCRDPEEAALLSAESVKTAFGAKGCCIFTIGHRNIKLEKTHAQIRHHRTYL